jgi:hypothetical protein
MDASSIENGIDWVVVESPSDTSFVFMFLFALLRNKNAGC